MAKPNKFYLIEIGGDVRAGFTEKRDCRQWLRERYPTCPKNLKVYRMERDEKVHVTGEMYKFV